MATSDQGQMQQTLPDAKQKLPEATRQATGYANGANRSKLMLIDDGYYKNNIKKAIEYTLPTELGSKAVKAEQVFRFVRALRAIAGLKDGDPRDLLPYVEDWHRRAPEHISGDPFEDVWFEFLYAWPRVKKPLSVDLLGDALKAAQATPVADLPYSIAEMRDLVALCRELQAVIGDDEPFWLSTRVAGRLLGVDHTTAWRWLYLLEQDGWIVTIEKGGREKNPRKATRFRYTGEGRTKKAEVSK